MVGFLFGRISIDGECIRGRIRLSINLIDWRRQPFNIMNKVLLTLTLISAVAITTHGQGQITFSPSTQKISVNSVIDGSATGLIPANASTTATTYYFALFASATAHAVGGTQTAPILGYDGTPAALQSTYAFADPNWELVDYGVNTVAGKFIGNEEDSVGTTTVPGIPGGSTAQFVVVGWNATLGSTIGQLESSLLSPGPEDGPEEFGCMGQSMVSGAITLGNGAGIPTSALFGPGATFIQGFTLGQFIYIPEPAALALGGLGGLALLAFRRKQG